MSLELLTQIAPAAVAAGFGLAYAREHSGAAAMAARNRRIIDTSLDAIITVAGDGSVTEWSAEAERMFGFSREHAIGANLGELIVPPARRAAHRNGLARALSGGSPRILGRRIETVAVRADGSEFPVELAITKVEGDEQMRYCAFVRDITPRKRAEQELRVAATSFEAQEGITITDADSRILRVNSAFTRLTGYAPEEVIGKTPAILKSGRQDEGFYRRLWDAVKRDGFWEGEIWNRRKNGDVYPEWLTITAVRSSEGEVTNYVGTFTDISRRKEAEEQIRNLAFFDALTGLPNRRLLLDRLQHAFATSARLRTTGALFFIDLDHFKTLNDTQGHEVGDLLLKEVARRLQRCVRADDTVARLGGDEFVIMLENLSPVAAEAAAQAEAVGEKVLEAIGEPCDLQGRPHRTTPSIGVTLFSGLAETVDEILRRADVAMYEAKAASRNSIRFFDPAMQAALDARMALEADMREAIERGGFELYYQLQCDHEDVPVGAEALIRWNHPARGLVSPASFIPLAEETGLIVPVGSWVIETACRQLQAWQAHPVLSELTLAINLSARQFRQPQLVDEIREALERSGANPARLKLELTETLVLEDVEGAVAKMEELRQLGVRFAMDDFGTGHSSLANLRRLPIEQLKIDRSFVRDIETDPNDAMIVQAIIGMANNLGLKVIAEGVETEGQQDFLARNGCYALQGYRVGRPVPVAQFERDALRGVPESAIS